MLKSIVAITAGASIVVGLGFLGAYGAGVIGATVGMVFGILFFFVMVARYVGN
ncbi:MAG TPA: hypothetical protein VNQ99_08855 [Xanthobacteraceae bacterium]|nr:hypothetical protein [Xanthobacteraceae bacterium]